MVNNIVRVLDRFTVRACRITLFIAGSLVVLMSIITTYAVIRRYIFNSPEAVSYEFSNMFLLFSFVLAVPELERLDRLLRVDIISDRLPDLPNQLVMNVVSPILGLVFCLLLTWKGGVDAFHALRTGQESLSAWPVPLGPVKSVIPLGYGLLCVVLLFRLSRGVSFLLKKKRPEGKERSV